MTTAFGSAVPESVTVALPDIKRRLLELGIEAQAGPPEEIAARLKAEIAKWSKVIDDAKIPKL